MPRRQVWFLIGSPHISRKNLCALRCCTALVQACSVAVQQPILVGNSQKLIARASGGLGEGVQSFYTYLPQSVFVTRYYQVTAGYLVSVLKAQGSIVILYWEHINIKLELWVSYTDSIVIPYRKQSDT